MVFTAEHASRIPLGLPLARKEENPITESSRFSTAYNQPDDAETIKAKQALLNILSMKKGRQALLKSME